MDYRELENFVRSKGVDECPACSHDHFVALDDPVRLTVGGEPLDVPALVCKHCGFVQLHAVSVVRELERPDDPQEAS